MEAYNSYNYIYINKNRYKKLDGEDVFLKWLCQHMGWLSKYNRI